MFMNSRFDFPIISRETTYKNYFKKKKTPQFMIDCFDVCWKDFTTVPYATIRLISPNCGRNGGRKKRL